MSIQPPTPNPKEITTRFLYPFCFERDKAEHACNSLIESTFGGPDQRPLPIWEQVSPPELYEQELLEHVKRFLFHHTASGCRYTRIASPSRSRWFNKVEVILREPRHTLMTSNGKERQIGETVREPLIWPVELAPLAAIEVFLTNSGVGMLSIALSPKVEDLDAADATLFNYKLSQLRPQVAARLHHPHPSENTQMWQRMPEEQKSKIAPAPATDAPLWNRLGYAGGSFSLGELITDVLLAPLSEFRIRPVQNQLSVYTVLHYGAEMDLEVEPIRTGLAAFISGVSQIEEPTHAGAPRGMVTVVNAILNRRHWAAAGLQGSAHLVADQPELDLNYNTQRVPRVLLKYFIPYLMAWFQRTSLQHSFSEASRFVLSDEESADRLAKLRQHMLQFSVDCYVPQISDRQAVDRYYGLAQEGLGVRRAFEDASRAITEIDTRFASEHQARITEALLENAKATGALQTQMTEHLRIVADVQTSVGWIEVFFVSVYLAELWHLVGNHIEKLKHWMPHSVIAFAVLGAVGAAAFLKPWQHRRQKD